MLLSLSHTHAHNDSETAIEYHQSCAKEPPSTAIFTTFRGTYTHSLLQNHCISQTFPQNQIQSNFLLVFVSLLTQVSIISVQMPTLVLWILSVLMVHFFTALTSFERSCW